MTDKSKLYGSESRRSFVKKGALAGSALALGASGSAAAQTTDGGTPTTPTDSAEKIDAVIQGSNFHPNGRFNFASGVVDFTPEFPAVARDVLASYNTYMIRWLNTNEMVPIWIEGDATLDAFNEQLGFIPDSENPNQPSIFEMDAGMQPFQESNHLVEVAISPIPQDEQENVLDTDEFYEFQDQAGTETPTQNGS